MNFSLTSTRNSSTISSFWIFPRPDHVPNERLLKTLRHYGIKGTTYSWIQAFLKDRTQQVLVEGETSDSIPAIPRGTVLGPLLFFCSLTTSRTVFYQVPGCSQMIASCIHESETKKIFGSYKRTLIILLNGRRSGAWLSIWTNVAPCGSQGQGS